MRLLGLLLLVLALGIAACGGGDSGPPPVPEGSSDPITTASGLQIIDIEIGDGAEVQSIDIVTVHFTAWAADGDVFDTSLDDGNPIALELATQIDGLKEGIVGMQVGGSRRLIIPPELAIGFFSDQSDLSPNSILTFDVAVLDTQPTPGKGDGSPPPVPEGSSDPLTTDSGLQIIDIEIGPGSAVQEGDSITVHYTGWLIDGTEFDTSLDEGVPITFELDPIGLIPGWVEGIPGMQVGGMRRLIIPAELAYGEARREGIPPNSILIFDIELLEVER